MLHAMLSGRFDTKSGENGSYFIDRDGTHIRFILNYLRTGELIVPNDEIIRRELLAEAKFYHVEGMITVLERAVYPFKDSVILSSTQGADSDELVEEHTRLFQLRWTCIELLEMVSVLPTFTPVVIKKGQQLQWSRVEITYLEDIVNKVGIVVSSKHWLSSLLSVDLKSLSENHEEKLE